MKDFGKSIIAILGIFFGALLLGFTGFETWNFLHQVTGNPIIAAIGLIMFEGGFLYWAAVFKKNAEGLVQMAISLLTSIADFAAVVIAVALQLGAVDQALLGAGTASKVVVAAVLVNLSAKYTFGLADPEQMKNIWQRAQEGVLLSKTFKAFGSRTDDIAESVADEMAETWQRELLFKFRTRHHAMTGQQNGQQERPALPTGKESFLDFLGRNGDDDDNVQVFDLGDAERARAEHAAPVDGPVYSYHATGQRIDFGKARRGEVMLPHDLGRHFQIVAHKAIDAGAETAEEAWGWAERESFVDPLWLREAEGRRRMWEDAVDRVYRRHRLDDDPGNDERVVDSEAEAQRRQEQLQREDAEAEAAYENSNRPR